MRVLIVEDDADLREVTRTALELAGWLDITIATDAASAREQLGRQPFDLVLLDMHLPDGRGTDVLRQLRVTSPATHTMIVSGAASEDERVAGLAAGADDYIVKPFSVRELIARITAVHRRRAAAAPPVLELEDLQIDVHARTISVGGVPVIVTRREFDLLCHLASDPGRTFTRRELLHAVWGSSSQWKSEATVAEHISRLRRKLETDPHNPSRLVTSRGVGYRLELHSARGSGPRDQSLADAGDATIVVSETGIVAATPAALAVLGADRPEQVVGHEPMEFIASASEAAAQVRRLRIRAGAWPRPELITLRRVDGAEVLVELASTPVTWHGSLATQMTMWDLARDTARLRELTTGIRSEIADAVVVANARAQIQTINAAAEELYGWRETEVIGRSIFDTFARGDDEIAIVQDQLLRDGHWHGLVRQPRSDGTAVTVNSSVTLVRDDADQPVGYVAVNRVPSPVSSGAGPAEAPGSINLELDVRRGLDAAEFVVHYQPVVRLEDRRWLGVEALARWHHRDRGLLLPADF
ncbi:MAG: two-component system, OmpR family, response regulator, partial [Actinomycetota bacterium]